MNVIEVNGCNFGSTGNVMINIAEAARKEHHNVMVCYPKSRDNLKKTTENRLLIGNRFTRNIHLILSKITGYNGCYSCFDTLKFKRKARNFKPRIIHLHNLHGWYINLPILFNYIKANGIHVVWTLHDCWSFTGQCPHFIIENCDKWKTGCHTCPQFGEYPASYVDRTKTMYRLKKKWFSGVQNLTIVTPSQWLADLVKQSFLKDYPVKVIHNGIDLSIYKPTPSNFREKYNLNDKFIVLGVAFGWGKRKGLDVFIDLAGKLDGRFQIVLVGTDEKVDKQLPANIISVHRTQNQTELAQIYTAADVFANPTREEVLGLVNIEALACGTPVITFNTGGSPECIDEKCGVVVDCDDNDAMVKEIINICENKPFSKEACFAKAAQFDMNGKYKEYVDLYESISITS